MRPVLRSQFAEAELEFSLWFAAIVQPFLKTPGEFFHSFARPVVKPILKRRPAPDLTQIVPRERRLPKCRRASRRHGLRRRLDRREHSKATSGVHCKG